MLIAVVPIVVLVLGLLLWLLAANPKVSQIGYVLFCVGAFFTVWVTSKVTLRLG